MYYLYFCNLKSNYIVHEKKLYLSLGPFVYYNGGG